MAKLSKHRHVLSLLAVGVLVGGCGSQVAEVQATPNTAPDTAVSANPDVELLVNEIGIDGLAEPGEPVVLWFWSPD